MPISFCYDSKWQMSHVTTYAQTIGWQQNAFDLVFLTVYEMWTGLKLVAQKTRVKLSVMVHIPTHLDFVNFTSTF